jgi:hypothetical protein
MCHWSGSHGADCYAVWNGRAANRRRSTSAILVVSIAMWFDVLCCRGGDFRLLSFSGLESGSSSYLEKTRLAGEI